uniref:Glycosyltransferase 2-like domain-containing protein n=1 Tax=Eubacterium plexicaudatum ASF492 TaxID=1235802 RepID=N2BMI5_9FIRM
MKKTPLISVIVPVFNVQEYVGKCVMSIRKQTYEHLEIVLIDDGSTDLSGLLCDKIKKLDARIQVIHKENGGLSSARNAGIDYAHGDFLFFVDSDDWIDPDTLELLVRIAECEHADIVECSYRNVFTDHVEEETSNTGELVIGDAAFAMQSQLDWRYFKSVAWNKLYKKSIFEDGKRYQIGRYHEDEFFTHQAFFSAKKLAYIDLSKYNYVRERDGSITGKVSSTILDGCYALRERVDFAIEKKMNEQLIHNIENVYCYFVFDRLYKCKRAEILDDRVEQLLEFVRNDRSQILLWNISERYKKLYETLCGSYEQFIHEWENY